MSRRLTPLGDIALALASIVLVGALALVFFLWGFKEGHEDAVNSFCSNEWIATEFTDVCAGE